MQITLIEVRGDATEVQKGKGEVQHDYDESLSLNEHGRLDCLIVSDFSDPFNTFYAKALVASEPARF